MVNVPAPTVPPTPPLAKPLLLAVKDIKFADASAAAEADVTSAGVFVLRGSPGAAEYFDEGQKTWRAVATDEELKQLKPIVAAYKQGAWEATFVGVGKKDASDGDAYAGAVNGQPTYFVRSIVKTKRGAEETTLSAASAPFTLIDEATKARFVTQFDTPTTKTDSAHKVRLLLKGDAMQPAGYLEVRSLPSFEVEIANCDAGGNVLARMLLSSSGEIRLTPAAGAKVVIEGDVETQRVLYAPAGGGAKQWLPGTT